MMTAAAVTVLDSSDIRCAHYDIVPLEYITELNNKLSAQKGIKVEFQTLNDANHFFSNSEHSLNKVLDKYIKKETALY